MVRQLSQLEPQQKPAQLWAEDFLEWKGVFRCLYNLFHLEAFLISELFFLDPIFESFMGSIHRCTKRLGFQPLERLGSGGRIFLLHGEGKHPHQNEGFFKVMNLSGTISPHLLRGLGITAGKNEKTHRGILELPLTH